jgi:hypothetical protein
MFCPEVMRECPGPLVGFPFSLNFLGDHEDMLGIMRQSEGLYYALKRSNLNS